MKIPAYVAWSFLAVWGNYRVIHALGWGFWGVSCLIAVAMQLAWEIGRRSRS